MAEEHLVVLAPGGTQWLTVMSKEEADAHPYGLSDWRVVQSFASKEEAVLFLNTKAKLEFIDPQYIRPFHPQFWMDK